MHCFGPSWSAIEAYPRAYHLEVIKQSMEKTLLILVYHQIFRSMQSTTEARSLPSLKWNSKHLKMRRNWKNSIGEKFGTNHFWPKKCFLTEFQDDRIINEGTFHTKLSLVCALEPKFCMGAPFIFREIDLNLGNVISFCYSDLTLRKAHIFFDLMISVSWINFDFECVYQNYVCL